jgi:hypothetical protein
VVIYLLLGAAVLALLVWAGRRPSLASQAVRLGTALSATLSAVGAIVMMMRGGWPISLLLIGLSAYLAQRARAKGPAGSLPGREAMSVAEARSILGVGPEADRAEVEAAYRRLMQRAHPDVGGSAGLAAQLNAARDRLLKS